MSHLENVLRRAIAALDPADRDGRRIALGNVRASMLRLLAVYEPPLSARAIEGKIDEVDALIRAIEAEFAAPPHRPVAPEPHEAVADPGVDADSGAEEWAGSDDDDAAYADDTDADFDADFDTGEEWEPPADEEEIDADEQPLDPPAPGRARGIAIALAALALLAIGIAGAIQFSPAADGPAVAVAPPASPPPAADAAAMAPGKPAAPVADAESTSPAVEPAPVAAAPPPAEAAENAAPPDPAPAAAETAAPPAGTGAIASYVVFDGHDPSVFRATPDNPVRFKGGTTGYAEISSSPTSNGAQLLVGRGVFERLAGHAIRIVVVARASADAAAATMRIAYQNGRQLSPWSDRPLGKDYQSISADWMVPKARSGPENDSILIEPGIPGDNTAADIRSVTIDILP